jgi:hypothetical protein
LQISFPSQYMLLRGGLMDRERGRVCLVYAHLLPRPGWDGKDGIRLDLILGNIGDNPHIGVTRIELGIWEHMDSIPSFASSSLGSPV